MSKLILSEAAYKGIPGVKKVERLTSPEYDRLAERANEKIREKQLNQARVWEEAERYFCK